MQQGGRRLPLRRPETLKIGKLISSGLSDSAGLERHSLDKLPRSASSHLVEHALSPQLGPAQGFHTLQMSMRRLAAIAIVAIVAFLAAAASGVLLHFARVGGEAEAYVEMAGFIATFVIGCVALEKRWGARVDP
jgi:hypothetical protein